MNRATRTTPPGPQAPAGFTLIELLIVVVVIGILAAIAIPNVVQMQDRAKEGSTKANMHAVQLAAEDYGIQNGAVYSSTMDATHIADLLPPNFTNRFTGVPGNGSAWENRPVYVAPPSQVPGIASYADSTQYQYNVKGFGKEATLTLVLTSGN